jgi:hypothetical protein
MTPSPSWGDILRRAVIGLSRRSDEPLRAAAIGSAVSCGFRETQCVSVDNGPVCACPSAERMAKICGLSRAGYVVSLTVPQPSIRPRSKQMEVPSDGIPENTVKRHSKSVLAKL